MECELDRGSGAAADANETGVEVEAAAGGEGGLRAEALGGTDAVAIPPRAGVRMKGGPMRRVRAAEDMGDRSCAPEACVCEK